MNTKFALSLLVLFMVAVTGCKKEDTEPTTQQNQNNQNNNNNNNPPATPYSANEKLVEATSDFYIIADIEGLPGQTKINCQKSNASCDGFASNCGIYHGYGFLSNSAKGSQKAGGLFAFGPSVVSEDGKTVNTGVCKYYASGAKSTDKIVDVNVTVIDGVYEQVNEAMGGGATASFEVTSFEKNTAGKGVIKGRFNLRARHYIPQSGYKYIDVKNGIFKFTFS